MLSSMGLLDTHVPSAFHLLIGGSLALLVYFTTLSIYRIVFHPLSKYPGPIQYKLSGWPLVWQAYRGNRHIRQLKDHEKYGPIVRISPNTLSFNTASALNAIYGPRSANVRKGEWYKTVDIAAGSYSSFTETDKDIHAAKRRWLSPAFSIESQKLNEPVINKVIQRFCETVKPTKGWGKNWDMAEETTHLGFDIMGAWTFGSDFRTVQETKDRDLADSILPAFKFLYWVSYLPLAALVRPLLRTKMFEIVGGKPVVDNNRLIDYAISQVQSQIYENDGGEKGMERINFLSRLVNVQDQKSGWRPTRADMHTECLNMMNAGADPYSGVIAGTFFYLVHNPAALEKAATEVRSAFASADEICNGSKLNSCAYLYACIEESLRRTAPVPSHMPRVVQSGGMDIDGHHLPEGTVVGVSQYAIHHNPTHFPDPWKFQPERWIECDSVPRESIDLARRAFNPFSLGTRGCIGKQLAYLQLKLTLAHLLYRYDMRISPDNPGRGGGGPGMEEGREREDEYQLWDAFGFGRDGPLVQFKEARWAS